jgi:hypothetical protein
MNEIASTAVLALNDETDTVESPTLPFGTPASEPPPSDQSPAVPLAPVPASLAIAPPPSDSPPSNPVYRDPDPLNKGRVVLDALMLRRLRKSLLLSQQDLANDCWRRNIRVSLPTIKRAELGRAVRFRVARELARYFDVPLGQIVPP